MNKKKKNKFFSYFFFVVYKKQRTYRWQCSQKSVLTQSDIHTHSPHKLNVKCVKRKGIRREKNIIIWWWKKKHKTWSYSFMLWTVLVAGTDIFIFSSIHSFSGFITIVVGTFDILSLCFSIRKKRRSNVVWCLCVCWRCMHLRCQSMNAHMIPMKKKDAERTIIDEKPYWN